MTFIELCLKNERMPLKIKTCSNVRSNLILLLVRFKGHYRKQPNYSINQRIFFLGQIKKLSEFSYETNFFPSLYLFDYVC